MMILGKMSNSRKKEDQVKKNLLTSVEREVTDKTGNIQKNVKTSRMKPKGENSNVAVEGPVTILN